MAKAKTKFPTKVQLRSIGIFNSADLARLGPDGIHLSCGMTRLVTTSHYTCQVIKIGEKSDPSGNPSNHGHKTFTTLWNLIRKAAWDDCKARAMAWTDEKYGKRDWVRDPFGDLQDARVLPRVWTTIEESKVESNA